MRVSPTPTMACDSMRSMSFTLPVKARSLTSSTRRSMSAGEMPVKDHTTLATGMSTSGKMSVGMRHIETRPSTTMRRATTTNV